MTAHECIFCAIIGGQKPAEVVREWADHIAIAPRHPVAPGHTLVIPRLHVADAGADPAVSAETMAAAAELADDLRPANIITSLGAEASQTVFHLHLHVVPRRPDDQLALPWGLKRRPVTVVYAREPIPAGPSVFLAGPTPRSPEVPSWRPDAVEEITARWTGPGPLTVLSPESRGGVRAEHYDDQIQWETAARARAAAILFWIPRDLRTMPAFTTNVEWGYDLGTRTGRVVLGCPGDCPDPARNRYLIWIARQHGVPVAGTLPDTVAAALVVAAGDLHSKPPLALSEAREDQHVR